MEAGRARASDLDCSVAQTGTLQEHEIQWREEGGHGEGRAGWGRARGSDRCLSVSLSVRAYVRAGIFVHERANAHDAWARAFALCVCVYVCVCINTTDTVRCKYYVFGHTNEHTYANAHTGVAQQIVHVTSSSEIPDVHVQMALLGVARLSTEVCLSVLIDAFAR